MYDYVGSKRIGHVKIGGQVRIRLSQIQAFIAKGHHTRRIISAI